MTRAALHCASALVLAIALASPASADDALVRGLLGLGTAVIVNGMQQNPQPQPYAPRNDPPQYRPAPAPSANRARTLELRAEIQRRLNALGFDAGTPDGVFGPRTRGAIADFQRSVGRPASGVISDGDIKVLYARSDGVVPPTTGFSALGGGLAKTGGFPALGSASDGAAAPAGFPTLGKAAAGTDGAGARAFPRLGAPPQDATGAKPGAFPTLGSAPKPACTAYPKFGAAPADAPAAFPAITTGDTAAPDAGPAMPALAQPGALAEQAAFAAQCPLVLSLAFAGTDRLTAADLAFVDLTGITRRAAADKARAEAAAKAKQKQFADDLRL